MKYVIKGLSQATKPEIKDIKHFNYISREYLDLVRKNMKGNE